MASERTLEQQVAGALHRQQQQIVALQAAIGRQSMVVADLRYRLKVCNTRLGEMRKSRDLWRQKACEWTVRKDEWERVFGPK